MREFKLTLKVPTWKMIKLFIKFIFQEYYGRILGILSAGVGFLAYGLGLLDVTIFFFMMGVGCIINNPKQ